MQSFPTVLHQPARPRAGRHLRRRAPRVALAFAAALAVALSVLLLAGPFAGALALAAAIVVLVVGALRLVAADDADIDEERWLRDALGSLDAPALEDEDEDGDLLVY
jgi:hypothetical protein